MKTAIFPAARSYLFVPVTAPTGLSKPSNQALTPSSSTSPPEQRDWAERVLAAAESGSGAVQLDGKMVDRPVLLRARAILDQLSI
jgi:citrate lyase beta subunit